MCGHAECCAHRSAGKLVDKLERLEIQILASAREQRLEVFEQRRSNELVAVQAERIEETTAQIFQFCRLCGQGILDVFG